MVLSELWNYEIIKQLILSLCLIFTLAWVFSYSKFFSYLMSRDKKYSDLSMVIFFSLISFLALQQGLVLGSGITSMRLLGPILGGLFGGYHVGFWTGLISGTVRYFYGTPIAEYTFYATIFVGLLSGFTHHILKGKITLKNGIIAILLIEIVYDFTAFIFLGKTVWWDTWKHIIFHRIIVDAIAVTIFLHMFELANIHKNQIDFYRNLSCTDYVTGISNYRHFRETLNKLLVNAQKRRLPISLIVISIDEFETLVSRQGYNIGGALLNKMSSYLKENLNGNLLFRLPESRFAVIIFGNEYEADRIACSLKGDLQEHFVNEYNSTLEIPISLSCGISSYPSHGLNSEQLISEAEKILAQEKRMKIEKKEELIKLGKVFCSLEKVCLDLAGEIKQIGECLEEQLATGGLKDDCRGSEGVEFSLKKELNRIKEIADQIQLIVRTKNDVAE